MSHCKDKMGYIVVLFLNAKQFDSHSRGMHQLGRVSLVAMVLFFGIAYGQEKPVEKAVSTGTIRGKVMYVADPKRPWRLGRYYIRNAKTGELAEAVVAIASRGLKATDHGNPPNSLISPVRNSAGHFSQSTWGNFRLANTPSFRERPMSTDASNPPQKRTKLL